MTYTKKDNLKMPHAMPMTMFCGFTQRNQNTQPLTF
jgi:hypothetical protein